jgi:hypothetical protein
LYEATFQEQYLQAAVDLTKTMVEKFWDAKDGGFYQTQNSNASMPRLKQVYDGATPSGNSVALYDLLWVSRLTNEPKYENMAIQMTEIFAEDIEVAPQAYTFFLSAIELLLGKSYSVVLVGDLKEEDSQVMVAVLKKNYLPTTIMQLKSPNNIGLGYRRIDGKATAYVCQNQTCLPPTNSTELMLKQLGVNQENIKS